MTKQTYIAGVEVDTRHWIGGERVASTHRFSDCSPIDGGRLARIHAGSLREVNSAVHAAREAFPAWSALGPQGRAPVLERIAEGIRDTLNDLAQVETLDNGSLLLGNRKNVINRCAHNIEYFAKFAVELDGGVIASEMVDNHVRYEPSGISALVTPWNAPLMLSTWKLGPALASGNTVVLKPPEWAPLSCSLLADITHQAGLPKGVFNVVQGRGATTGNALVSHNDIDRLSFTGSPKTAQRIGRAAAKSLTPVSLELGGKSPFVVFADADLDAAARTIAHQYINAGQVCLAGTRILVERCVGEVLLDKVKSATAQLPVGDPRELSTRIGPLIHPVQHRRVCGFVERALDAGAEVLFGAEPHPAGALFYSPTLLANVNPSAEIFQQEVFGPVLTWTEFEDETQAVDLANATRYALGAMVYTTDSGKAQRVASRIVAGTVWVNCFFVRDLGAPFGGARMSGIGREGGRWSFDFFCDLKNVAIRRGSFEADEYG